MAIAATGSITFKDQTGAAGNVYDIIKDIS